MIKKIICACSGGIGSSLIMRINTSDVLKELGYNDIEVINLSISEVEMEKADLYIFGSDQKQMTSKFQPTILLKNIMNKGELKSRLKEYLENNS